MYQQIISYIKQKYCVTSSSSILIDEAQNIGCSCVYQRILVIIINMLQSGFVTMFIILMNG